MSAIRFATVACLDELVLWGQDFHNTCPYAGEKLKRPDAIELYLRWHIISTEACIIRTDTGMIGGVLQPALDYLDGFIVRESFLWCDRPGDGLRLISALEEWAKDRGATHVEMSVMGDTSGNRLSNILMRRGYKSLQATLAKEVKRAI